MRSLEEIKRYWSPELTEPVVSVECIVYHNEGNLAQALDSMLDQETGFPFEIIVHDDASSDATPEIIRRYEKAYPGIVKAICQQENQLSQGIRPDTFTSRLHRGKYIASCEGDDYWVDRYKLAKQVAMLEKHPECDLCFHSSYKIEVGSTGKERVADYGTSPRLVPAGEIIERRHGSIATASVMVRSSIIGAYLEFMAGQEDKVVGDVYFQIMAAIRGGGCYLPDAMSVYRYKVPGSWSDSQARNPGIKLQRLRQRICSHERLDALTDYRFTRHFKASSRHLILKGVKEAGVTFHDKYEFYTRFSHYLGVSERAFASLVIMCPWLVHLIRRMRARASRHLANRAIGT